MRFGNPIPQTRISEIRAIIQSIVPITNDEWAAFEPGLRLQRVKRGEDIFRIGDLVNKIYFVNSGLLRSYYLDENGNEVNRNFIVENQFIASIMGIYAGAPSNYGIQALEDSALMFFTNETIASMYERHPLWERLGRLIAEKNLVDKEAKEERYRKLAPVEHYKMIKSTRPDLIDRVPLYHLAGYLGITPETLSRIRGRIGPKSKEKT